jgi:GxxExxY protein
MSHVNKITESIIQSAIEVHRALGPGLLESTYQACLKRELELRGHRVETEVPVPVRYKGIVVRDSLRIDLLVDHLVIVEIKVAEKLIPIHRSQVLSYLRLKELPVGLLINFNVRLLKDGVRRVVLDYNGPRPSEEPANC